MAEILGLLSLVIAVLALVNTRKTDRIIRAIANLEYDEKLAIMAVHLGNLRKNNELTAVENARNDLHAVSNLKGYASLERKERLIRDYVIPMIQACIQRNNLTGGVAVAVNDMIDAALTYGTEVATLERLRQQVRGA